MKFFRLHQIESISTTHSCDKLIYGTYNYPLFFIIQVEDVRMIDRYNTKNPSVGTLYLTATHTIFVDPEANKETWV